MFRKYTASTLLVVLMSSLVSGADTIVECRVATAGISKCNPYTHKIIRAKEIKYDNDRKKLIVDKTVSTPRKKERMHVISVADMIEKYVKVEEPLRFKGSQQSSYTFTKPHKKPLHAAKHITPAPSSVSKADKTPQVIRSKPVSSPLYGIYRVESGDILGRIAEKFNVPVKQLIALNHLDKEGVLKIGEKLKLPIPQEKIEILRSGVYKIAPGDSLISIARKFSLDPKKIAKFNHITSNTMLRAGQSIKLPFPHIVKEAEKAAKEISAKKKKLAIRKKRVRMLKPFGKHRLRVTATAYSSHSGQTDSTPFLAAWNNRIRPGMKIIAVSRDLLTRYGLRNGSRVKIGGLPGYYTVRDKMNKRFRKRIDIYMGTNRRRALRWGRRSVTISW